MKKIKRNIFAAALALVLILIIFFCFSGSVYSQSKTGISCPDKEAMERLEREYLEQTAELMKEYGCRYSGITMTKVFSGDGSRSYQVLIHHRNLSFLNEDEFEELRKRLEELSDPFGGAKFTYGFSCLS